MIGFNFKEHKIMGLSNNYAVKSIAIDYSTEYLEKDLETGSRYITGVFDDLVASLEPNRDYFIQVGIDEFLVKGQDDFLLFSAFSRAFQGTPNTKGYLKAPERISKKMGGAEYNKTVLMNNDFEYGTIQLEISTKDEVYEWIR